MRKYLQTRLGGQGLTSISVPLKRNRYNNYEQNIQLLHNQRLAGTSGYMSLMLPSMNNAGERLAFSFIQPSSDKIQLESHQQEIILIFKKKCIHVDWFSHVDMIYGERELEPNSRTGK